MLRLYLIGVQWAIFFLFVWAAQFYARKQQPWWTKDTLINFTFSAWLRTLKVLIYIPLFSALDAFFFQRFHFLPRILDIGHLHMHPVVQFVVIFLLDDIIAYWTHRAEHHFPFMWHFHRVHHSVEQMDASSNERIHPVETFYEFFILYFFYAMNLSLEVLVVYVVLRCFSSAYRHSNFHYPMTSRVARLFNLVFNNPHFHGWHHETNPQVYDRNYGATLTLWDRLFGTHYDTDKPPMNFGLGMRNRLANSFIGLNLVRRDRA